MTQHEAVIKTLEKLGGLATLGQLNQEVMKIQDCVWKTKTPFASIRRIVQINKEIYKIRPGLYGLKKYLKRNEENGIIIETEKNKDSKDINEFNHSYYQGLLLLIGNMKGLGTFIPNQDKNKKFIDKPLGEIRTLKSMPQFSYQYFIKRSSSVDVIWFNERKMPHSFFEIEYSTDIQNSLVKFNDLQDFYSRMIIVSDKLRKNEFQRKINYSSFNELSSKARVDFLDYDSLIKQYESLIQQSQYDLLL